MHEKVNRNTFVFHVEVDIYSDKNPYDLLEEAQERVSNGEYDRIEFQCSAITEAKDE